MQPSRLGVNELAQPCASFSKLDSRRGDRGVNYIPPLKSGFTVQTRRDTTASLKAANDESIFKTYLDIQSQGRNEYLNLASQIGYNGSNIAYIFYENQIRKFIIEAPCDEQKLEAWRASCLRRTENKAWLILADT